AFMAPTEILAAQHFKTLADALKDFDISVGLLTGKTSLACKNGKVAEIKKRDLLLELEFNQINIVIGTHSLIQKGVKFSKLALMVIDEQHRFGVNQRAQLVKGSIIPHLLS